MRNLKIETRIREKISGGAVRTAISACEGDACPFIHSFTRSLRMCNLGTPTEAMLQQFPTNHISSKPPNTDLAIFYQAHLARTLFGYLRTNIFLPSSNNKIPIPNAMGKNQYSAGIGAVCNEPWNAGT